MHGVLHRRLTRLTASKEAAAAQAAAEQAAAAAEAAAVAAPAASGRIAPAGRVGFYSTRMTVYVLVGRSPSSCHRRRGGPLRRQHGLLHRGKYSVPPLRMLQVVAIVSATGGMLFGYDIAVAGGVQVTPPTLSAGIDASRWSCACL